MISSENKKDFIFWTIFLFCFFSQLGLLSLVPKSWFPDKSSIFEAISVLFLLTFMGTASALIAHYSIDHEEQFRKYLMKTLKKVHDLVFSLKKKTKIDKYEFKYFSDSKLKSIYEDKEYDKTDINIKLALEAELVSRKILKYSPSHEKLFENSK